MKEKRSCRTKNQRGSGIRSGASLLFFGVANFGEVFVFCHSREGGAQAPQKLKATKNKKRFQWNIYPGLAILLF